MLICLALVSRPKLSDNKLVDTQQKIALYRSLFRGREDIFAKRWEKGEKSGYMPAYSFDWTEFNAHRAHGGKLHDFENKTPIPLDDQQIYEHLTGTQMLGIYPVLPDNTSYFLAADFDKGNWLDDCMCYQQQLEKYGLTSYIERSRSGNGGHVWTFFADAYPCHKARAIGLEAIRKALKFSDFDKEISFDRLFPNQDTIAKDGLGNLIALPFQGKAAQHGNTVFIDSSSGEPFSDQFAVLTNIRKHTTAGLDAAYEQATSESSTSADTHHTNKLIITVDHAITLQKSQLTSALTVFIRNQLNFLSTEYLTKKRLGKSLYQTQKYFRLIKEGEQTVSLPRGFLHRLTTFLDENNLPYDVNHTSPTRTNVKFKSKIVLKDNQEQLVQSALDTAQGVLVAPPGSGKTMMGLELIARQQKPALILVHRQQIYDQWIDRIQKHLGIAKAHIGRVSSGKKSVGKKITVGMLQSLARSKELHELRDTFGTIIIDECHHVPAKTFRGVISELNPQFMYGLTATPTRKHNDEQLIYVYIGDIIGELSTNDTSKDSKSFEIATYETRLAVPFDWHTDSFDLIAKIISYDTARNQQIVEDILQQVALNRKTLVLSERKEHLKILELYLKGKCETLLFTGDDSAASRTSKLAQIESGHYQVLLCTGPLIGEGVHIDNIEALVLAFPFAFEGKLVQYIGRLNHSTEPKILIDYHDKLIPFLDRQFKARQKVYKKIRQEVS